MPCGGARPGAGRKKGSKTARTQAIVEKATAEGITPLEVMLKAMRAHFKANRLDQAAACAKDAAPYIHPRLAAIEYSGNVPAPIAALDCQSLMFARRVAMLLMRAGTTTIDGTFQKELGNAHLNAEERVRPAIRP